ncbi:hypothetical protein RBS60_17730 [Sinomonas sp. ASV486]|uniref:hypothetical protein n=1 Tax=Sinomonas sp. ASV486 TaxID=3051170 RepID=UPI0027DE4B2C|nr:hypothetical protein [Sinomonas sp. ASV486]MDQ4492045.1 hypothetical protein [Sinomonas sp. ASV486]
MPTTGIVRPVTITLAFWMLVVSAVLPLAGIPAALDWMHTYLRAAILEATAPSGRAKALTFIEQFNATSAPLVWISALVGIAVSVLIALGIRAGMNWVRILLTVFAGLSLLGYLGNAAVALMVSIPRAVMFVPPVIVYVFSILSAILYIAATVLTWLRPSNEYVAARRAAALGGGYLR